jgi:hypothetical protein
LWDKSRKWPCLAFNKATNDNARCDIFTSISQKLVIKLISTFVASLSLLILLHITITDYFNRSWALWLATAILVSFDSPCMAKPHNKHKASISTPSYISQKLNRNTATKQTDTIFNIK